MRDVKNSKKPGTHLILLRRDYAMLLCRVDENSFEKCRFRLSYRSLHCRVARALGNRVPHSVGNSFERVSAMKNYGITQFFPEGKTFFSVNLNEQVHHKYYFKTNTVCTVISIIRLLVCTSNCHNHLGRIPLVR